jgi:hypothetical protein
MNHQHANSKAFFQFSVSLAGFFAPMDSALAGIYQVPFQKAYP